MMRFRLCNFDRGISCHCVLLITVYQEEHETGLSITVAVTADPQWMLKATDSSESYAFPIYTDLS
jgi:hypothetical protein